jgi:hypothetical protein
MQRSQHLEHAADVPQASQTDIAPNNRLHTLASTAILCTHRSEEMPVLALHAQQRQPRQLLHLVQAEQLFEPPELQLTQIAN